MKPQIHPSIVELGDATAAKGCSYQKVLIMLLLPNIRRSQGLPVGRLKILATVNHDLLPAYRSLI